MLVAGLKALTWVTAFGALTSALLLAVTGGTMPRIASLVGDATRAAPAASATHSTADGSAPRAAGPSRDTASH